MIYINYIFLNYKDTISSAYKKIYLRQCRFDRNVKTIKDPRI